MVAVGQPQTVKPKTQNPKRTALVCHQLVAVGQPQTMKPKTPHLEAFAALVGLKSALEVYSLRTRSMIWRRGVGAGGFAKGRVGGGGEGRGGPGRAGPRVCIWVSASVWVYVQACGRDADHTPHAAPAPLQPSNVPPPPCLRSTPLAARCPCSQPMQ